MAIVSTMRHQDKFEHWRSHDIKTWPALYGGLAVSDYTVFWEHMEANYLSKYRTFLQVAFEWGAEGLWEMKFPGSVEMGKYRSVSDFRFPSALIQRIQAWHRLREEGANPWGPSDDFDYGVSNLEGVAIAKAVKLEVGPDVYVEYLPFREIVILNGVPNEAPFPGFVTELCGKGRA